MLHDDDGAVARVLAAYEEPASYRPVRAELRAPLTAATCEHEPEQREGLERAAVRAARTAVHLTAAERGRHTFDPRRA